MPSACDSFAPISSIVRFSDAIPTRLPKYGAPALKIPYATLPMSSAAMPANRLVPIGNVQLYDAVVALLRRRGQTCRGCPSRTTSTRYVAGRSAKCSSASAFGVEMRHAVVVLRASASACRRAPSAACVLERRPDDVFDAGRSARVREVLRLGRSLFPRKNAPRSSSRSTRRRHRQTRASGCPASSRSAVTTSAPRAASARALSLEGSRVIARQANPPAGSFRIASHRPPP